MSPTPSSSGLGRIGRHYPPPGRSALDGADTRLLEPAQHSIAGALLVLFVALTLAGWLFVLWTY
jgi:hypothetical protein